MSIARLLLIGALLASAPAWPESTDGHHGTQELVRIGGEYAFHLSDGWEIAPQLNVDIVDSEEVWVFGVVFARGF